MVSVDDDPRPVLVAEQKFHPGNPVTVVGASPCTAFQAVFEDEGDTGYFYGLDTRARKGMKLTKHEHNEATQLIPGGGRALDACSLVGSART